MGCKQSITKPPPPVLISTTLPGSPYVKSALKQTHANGKRKTERLSFLKRKPPTATKSVNFDEKVQVKSRTPTPKQTRSENSLSTKILKKPIPDDDTDDDGQVSSISSQEEVPNEQIRTISGPSIPSLQRNQQNGFRQKTNSIGVGSPKNNIREKNPPSTITKQQPPVTMTTTNPPENPIVSSGHRFKVRRKVQYAILPETSSPVGPMQSPLPVQRPLPNTNAMLVEHRTSIPNGIASPQTAYYEFTRRTPSNLTSTEK